MAEPIFTQYFTLFRKYLPLGGDYPPALTSGLLVFLTGLYLYSWVSKINETFSLNPWAIAHLELTRLSMYPLVHNSFFHLLFNLISLVSPLSQFERSHGTVYTGITLNNLALFTAIPYCIFGMLFYPKNAVLGASGWVFSFIGYFALKQSETRPTITISGNLSLPTLYIPVIALVLMGVLVPGSSFVGHFFGLAVGYILGLGYFDKLLEGPSKVVIFIEGKLGWLIGLIPSQLNFYKEVDMKENRKHSYTPAGTFSGESSFSGEGVALGRESV